MLSCICHSDKQIHLCAALFISVARLTYTLHSRWMHLRLHEALRVILAPAVTRRIFHASHFLVTDTRLSDRQLLAKGAHSLFCLWHSMHTPRCRAANVVAFNGIRIEIIYGVLVSRYFWPSTEKRESAPPWHILRTSKEVIQAINPYAFIRKINPRAMRHIAIIKDAGVAKLFQYEIILWRGKR